MNVKTQITKLHYNKEAKGMLFNLLKFLISGIDSKNEVVELIENNNKIVLKSNSSLDCELSFERNEIDDSKLTEIASLLINISPSKIIIPENTKNQINSSSPSNLQR